MQSHMYDIVFLDLEMPVMNGYRCAQAIRQWTQLLIIKGKQALDGRSGSGHGCPLGRFIYENALLEGLGRRAVENRVGKGERIEL